MFDKIKGAVNGVLLNRMVIALASAAGGVIATTFPKVTAAFCGG